MLVMTILIYIPIARVVLHGGSIKGYAIGSPAPDYSPECRCSALCSKYVLHGVVKCPFVLLSHVFFSKEIVSKSLG